MADYPGAIGEKEAVFEVGSGRHSFSGPELVPTEAPSFGAVPGDAALGLPGKA